MDAQIGDIWLSSNNWIVLLLEELPTGHRLEKRFKVMYLDDGYINSITIGDNELNWTKLA